MAQQHGNISLQFRCVIAICRLLYGSSFDEIERKTGVQKRTAQRIIQRAIERVKNENINDIITYLGDVDRFGRLIRIPKGSIAFRKIR